MGKHRKVDTEEVNDDALFKYIGEALRREREAQKLTQGDVAKGCGMERTSITNLESGRQKIPLSTLYLICGNLGIEPISVLPSTREVYTEPVSINWEFVKQTSEEVNSWPEWKKEGWDTV